MANMTLIETKTVGAGGASSIDFTSISTDYTDLKLMCSTRSATGSGEVGIWVRLNGDSGQNYNWKMFWGGGNSNYGAYSQNVATNYNRSFFAYATSGNYTANTFGNTEIYIPNYKSTLNKSVSIDSVGEHNSGTAYRSFTSGIYSTSSPITSINIFVENGTDNFAEGTTVSLYGISAVTASPKATGGIISQDTTYWYHMFPFTGTFTPTSALTADILCIAGGGGGGSYNYGGGGGAGGLRGLTNQSLTTTAYTITVGAGGTFGSGGTPGTSGGNSSVAGSGFTTITASGGGGGGGDGSSGQQQGLSGGSGGGNYNNLTSAGGAGNAGGYSPVEGYAGGAGSGSAAGSYGAGGGGGAGGAANSSYGYGGIGSSAYSSWGLATGTGENVSGTVYFAGGGGGGAGGGLTGGYAPNLGGRGGGGYSGIYNGTSVVAQPGLANSGGGGGGGGSAASKSGGSGVVIIRYAK